MPPERYEIARQYLEKNGCSLVGMMTWKEDLAEISTGQDDIKIWAYDSLSHRRQPYYRWHGSISLDNNGSVTDTSVVYGGLAINIERALIQRRLYCLVSDDTSFKMFIGKIIEEINVRGNPQAYVGKRRRFKWSDFLF